MLIIADDYVSDDITPDIYYCYAELITPRHDDERHYYFYATLTLYLLPLTAYAIAAD